MNDDLDRAGAIDGECAVMLAGRIDCGHAAVNLMCKGGHVYAVCAEHYRQHPDMLELGPGAELFIEWVKARPVWRDRAQTAVMRYMAEKGDEYGHLLRHATLAGLAYKAAEKLLNSLETSENPADSTQNTPESPETPQEDAE